MMGAAELHEFLSFDDALARLYAWASPLGVEEVTLDEAAGRVLAEPIVARLDSPRFDASAMDGYAVADRDIAGLPATLPVIGESVAGGEAETACAGNAVRIYTGAPMPAGADRVVIQEDVDRCGDGVTIPAIETKRHVRQAGSDFRAGATLIEQGRLLGPREIVVAASADVGTVAVHRQPRLALIATGDELLPPGAAGGSRRGIPDSVSGGVAALAAQWGGRKVSHRQVGDDPAALAAAVEESRAGADIVLLIGGASVGDRDHSRRALAGQDLEWGFAKVRMKPGKPAWAARIRGGPILFGLPGNPTAAMTVARLMLAPLLCVLSGRPAEAALAWRTAVLAGPIEAGGAREAFLCGASGAGGVRSLDRQDASSQRLLAAADVLIRRRPDVAAAGEGARVEVLDF